MAYVSKEKKAKIRAELKKVVPKDWKWSLAVDNHSTIVMTVYSAPVDLMAEYARVVMDKLKYKTDYHSVEAYKRLSANAPTYVDVNPYWFRDYFDETLEVIENIMSALNTDNYNNSDIQADYFDVGHYVDLNLGRWNKPFVYTGEPAVDVEPVEADVIAAANAYLEVADVNSDLAVLIKNLVKLNATKTAA
ncbi:MAG: hypothetical protein BV459_00230 [Thermoplasmata archaeon M11B2D]|nr:MAG: hypothetical protein BV459_00230 [Thermoplasmata archaeon M11B2D]